MIAKDWSEIDRVLGDALERPAGERVAFVRSTCGDRTDLADVVLALLAEADRRGPFDTLDANDAASADGGESLSGLHLGPYRLVREIGRGGMGTVWLAERDDQQFSRRVAVKLLSTGLPASEALRRFRDERQILASLEHPNIAHLLDAGCTDAGLHYLVMDFVEGTPITEHCRVHQLDVAARAALLRTIASTVHFAHQRLVVHRDLKPANILVTPGGEPRLLDFGVAKILAPDTASATVPLLHLATPAYASPEQMKGLPVTTASDIYSLGVIARELFAGAGATRDLDAIVAKATREMPEERYLSGRELGDDLERYLDGLPVLARAGTLRYRARKFVARHSWAVAAGAIALLLGAAAIAAIVRSSRAAARQRAVAERRFDEVRGLARAMIFEVHDRMAQVPGATAARQAMVTQVLRYLDRLARDGPMNRELALELANAYIRVGEVQYSANTAHLGDTAGALASFEHARAILANLAESESSDVESRRLLARTHGLSGSVQLYLRQRGAAKASIEAELRLRESLSSDAPQDRRGLGSAYYSLGSLLDDSDPEASVTTKRRALEIFESLLAADPENREAQRNVALSCKSLGATLDVPLHRTDEAEGLYLRALALDEARAAAEPGSAGARMDVSFDLSSLASLLARQDDPASLEYWARTIAIRRGLVDVDPRDARARGRLAYAFLKSGMAKHRFADYRGAIEDLQAAVALADHLLSLNPDDAIALSYAAEGLNNMAGSEALLARSAGAAERAERNRRGCDALRRAVVHYRRNIRNGTATSTDRSDLLSAEQRLGPCQ